MPARSIVSLTLLALAAGSATSMAQTDRYWVAPLIGFWDDAGNWSLSDGGPAGGGIPLNNDTVRMTTRSTCLFNGQLGLPVQAVTILAGTGSGQGRTLLSQSAGLMRSGIIRVGSGTPRNDLKISGGSLNVNDMYVGEFGGEGLLEVSGTGSVGPVSSFNRLYVGFADGDGTVEINGGSADFDEVYLSIDTNTGTPGGPADLIMTDGTLDVGEFYVGYGGLGFAQFSGGSATLSECTVGFAGESGGLRPQLNVGTGGDLDINGTLTIGDFEETVGEEPGFGRVLVTGGSLSASQVHIAQDAGTDGELIVEGGSFSAPNIRVGLGGNGLLEVGGGQVFATMVGIGDAAIGVGQATITGGTLFPNTLDVGAAAGSTGFLSQFDGSVDAGFARIGKPGAEGSVTMFGGLFSASTLFIGAGGTAEFRVSNGSVEAGTIVVGETNTAGDQPFLEVQDGTVGCNRLLIGSAPGGEGGVFLSGGTITATEVEVGDDPAGDGRVILNGGVFNAEEFNIGVLGNGDVSLFSGTIDVDALHVGGVLSHEGQMLMSGGTLIADLIDVQKDGTLFFEFNLSDGLIQSQQLLIGEGAGFSFGDGLFLDARISEVINDGEFRYNDGDGVLSGPLIFNSRLLGQFTNNGELRLIPPTLVPGGFVMNLTNNGLLNVFGLDEFIVSGAIANGPDGRIFVRRSFDIDPGFLQSDNTNGISNAGDFELQLGIVEIPNGSFTNTGALAGFGEIRAPLINNGQILPSPTQQTQSRELVVDSLQSGPASSVRVVITENGHNSITSLGTTALDGTLNLAFAQGVPLPPRGTEYDLVVSPNEIIAGNFASAAILGYPCEIISGRNRVFARTLRCNVADFAQPFGVLDLADIAVFTSGFTGGNPLVDINGDTILDLADIGLFVAAFTGGCP